MDPFIECVGDPRAMGHCQGLAHRAVIQQHIVAAGGKLGRSRWPTLAALTSGADLSRGTGREVIRHYTHLAERMAGIARNADVSFSSLMELFNRSTSGAAPEEELVAAAVAVGARTSEVARAPVQRSGSGLGTRPDPVHSVIGPARPGSGRPSRRDSRPTRCS